MISIVFERAKTLRVLAYIKERNMKYVLASVIAILLCVSGCKKNDNPVDPVLGQGIFELSAGKTWMYAWSMTGTDSLGNILSSATDSVRVSVASTDDTLGSYQHLVRLEAQSIPRPRGIARLWYQFSGDSLVEIAYSNVGASPIAWPKRSAQSTTGTIKEPPAFSLLPKAVIALLRSKGFADSVLFRDDSRVAFEFPLSVGKTWTTFSYPFPQIREVVGTETIQCPGGSFVCAKVKTTDPTIDSTMVFYDYVSINGLIKREVNLTAMAVTIENPDGPGQKMWYSESLLLISNQ